MSVLDERVRRRRARRWTYLAVAAAVVVLLSAGLVNAALSGAPSDVPASDPPSPGDAAAPPGAPEPAPAAVPGVSGPAAGPGAAAGPGVAGLGWDVGRERAIAAAPMPMVSATAAAPQVLSARDPGPPIDVPGAGGQDALVAEGFPPTPPGAVAQLAALDTVALHDLNPGTYSAAYRSISLPGAPDPAGTPLGAEVADTYQRISVAATEPAPIFSRWQLAGALVKGSSDGGAFVVVCVLGELEAAAQNSAAAGVGDCQAMRYVATGPGGPGQWRIAPGPAVAAAPDTWPGSDAALSAGYRPVTGAVPG